MKPLDTEASLALDMLENRSPRIRQEKRFRSAWSRFLMSLMLRMPQDIAILKTEVADEWTRHTPDLEQRYAERRRPDEPASLEEAIEAMKGDPDWTMQVAEHLMDHKNIGAILNNMRWLVTEISSEYGEFLTSDRPIMNSGGMNDADYFLMLPIGPKRLFAAVNNVETERRINTLGPDRLVAGLNQFIIERANQFVYARDDSHLGTVEAHFGAAPTTSVLQRLAARRSQTRPS